MPLVSTMQVIHFILIVHFHAIRAAKSQVLTLQMVAHLSKMDFHPQTKF